MISNSGNPLLSIWHKKNGKYLLKLLLLYESLTISNAILEAISTQAYYPNKSLIFNRIMHHVLGDKWQYSTSYSRQKQNCLRIKVYRTRAQFTQNNGRFWNFKFWLIHLLIYGFMDESKDKVLDGRIPISVILHLTIVVTGELVLYILLFLYKKRKVHFLNGKLEKISLAIKLIFSNSKSLWRKLSKSSPISVM